MFGCSTVTSTGPGGDLVPMWADTSCWGNVRWVRCQQERKFLGVREGHFVTVKHVADRSATR